ncbi:MAG: type I-B CRISPR-associated protein Cas8b1/Cst1 [Kosmotogaceae bacterium]
MKVYTSNWLINMGIVGFLRILKYSGVDITKLFNEDGSIELTEDLLDNFGHKYLAYSIYRFTKELIDDLPYSEDLENLRSTALAKLKETLEETNRQLAEKPKDKNYLKTRKDKKDKIKDKLDKLSKTPNKLNLLQVYYTNLPLIGNPSKKSTDLTCQAQEITERYSAKVFDDQNEEEDTVACSMCARGRVEISGSDNYRFFQKAYFVSLGVSLNEFVNYFYNLTPQMYLCRVCRLFLICTFAGLTKKPKDHVDQTNEVFVNHSAFGIEDLLNINENISFISSLENSETLLEKLIELSLSGHIKRRSQWSLENTQFIEMHAKRQDDTPNLKTYSLSPDVARLFADPKTVDTNLKNITGSIPLNEGTNEKGYMKQVVLKNLINGKDLMEPVFLALRTFVKTDGYFVWLLISAFNTIVLSARRNSIRSEIDGGAKNMGERGNYGILRKYQEIGQRDFTHFELDKKKRMSYVLLSLIHNNKAEEFYENLLKIYINSDRSIPEEIVGLLSESQAATFKEKAFAFMTGFLMGKGKEDNEDKGGNQ